MILNNDEVEKWRCRRETILLRAARYGGPGALLEYAVMHGDEAEAERIRAELRKHAEDI